MWIANWWLSTWEKKKAFLSVSEQLWRHCRGSEHPLLPTWYPIKCLCWGWAGTCKGWRSLDGFLCSQNKKKSHRDKGTHVSSQDEALPGDGHPCSSWLHQSWIPELRKPHCRVQFTSEKSLLVMALQIDGFAFSPSVARALLGEGTPHPTWCL